MRRLVFALLVLAPGGAYAESSPSDSEPPRAQLELEQAPPGATEPPSKKERFLDDKSRRRDVHARHAPPAGTLARRAVSLRNMWTHEVLPIEVPTPPPGAPAASSTGKGAVKGAPKMAAASVRNAAPGPASFAPPPSPPPSVVNGFLRDHFTNQATHMDTRLVRVVLQAAAKFGADAVEVVSAYRSPKYNLMLRKKGHAVARESQHPLGQAVDFRLPGLSTRALYTFVRTLRLGGVGYYPHSEFVHADVGPIRTWKGN